MNQQIRWLFLDLGSTLIDESDCAEYRTRELLKQPNAPTREVLEKRMIELAMENHLPYKDVAREFGLKTIKWPSHLEKLYAGTQNVLETLKKKYHLGIIAAEIGMNTIWVRQGSFAYGSVELVKHKPDYIVNSIVDVLKLV